MIAQLEAAARWNGERGAACFRQHHKVKNHDLSRSLLADAARHFVNHDRLRRQIWMMERTR